MTRDKKTVLSIIFGIVWFSVYSWFPNPEIKDLIRTSIGAILCLFLYMGINWSRWVLGALSALGLVAGLLSIVRFTSNPSMLLPLGLMSLFYAYSAYTLLNPKLLNEHFNSERT